MRYLRDVEAVILTLLLKLSPGEDQGFSFCISSTLHSNKMRTRVRGSQPPACGPVDGKT